MKNVVIFEVEGWNDKWENGYRKDTYPIAHALKELNYKVDIIFYHDNMTEQEKESIKSYDAYISRVNPGNIPGGEQKYLSFLQNLCENEVIWMSSPKTMTQLWAKDSLLKLIGTWLVPEDMYCYKNIEEMQSWLLKSIKKWTRVLKQNRWSAWEWIWKVKIIDQTETINQDTKILCIEAFDNHEEEHTIKSFLEKCSTYYNNDGIMIDMPFLERISEWEIRVLLIWKTPHFIVHKKPSSEKNAFSATLFSWAKYTYQSPDEYPEINDILKNNIDIVLSKIWIEETPLIWTIDFILDDWEWENSWNKYIIGEINCSCVWFTSHLEHGIQESIAQEVKKRLE